MFMRKNNVTRNIYIHSQSIKKRTNQKYIEKFSIFQILKFNLIYV